MTRADAKKLHSGDEVFWNDPDGGLCSRHLKIQSIRLEDDTATIVEPDGSVVEVFLDELQ